MKKFAFVILSAMFLVTLASWTNAAENFDDPSWSTYLDDGLVSIDPSSTTVYLSASHPSYDPSWAQISKNFPGAIGYKATVNVSSMSGMGGAIGIRKYIAVDNTTGNRILAQIDMMAYNGSYYVFYQIRERLPDSSTNVRTICRGNIGNYTGMWTPGDSIDLAFWYLEGKVYFHSSVVPEYIAEAELTQGLIPKPENTVDIYTWTEGDGVIAGSVTNFMTAATPLDMETLIGKGGVRTAYIPHVTGPTQDWIDYLHVDNLSASAASYTVTLYGPDGSQVFSGQMSIPALTKTAVQLKGFGAGAENAVAGKITFAEPQLKFRLSQVYIPGGGVAQFLLNDILSSKLAFLFSDFMPTLSAKGLALTNFGSTTAQVTLEAISNGVVQGTTSVSIAPNTKLLNTYNNLFGSLAISQVQVIRATTTYPDLAGVVVTSEGDLGFLLFTPAVPIDR